MVQVEVKVKGQHGMVKVKARFDDGCQNGRWRGCAARASALQRGHGVLARRRRLAPLGHSKSYHWLGEGKGESSLGLD